MKRQTMLIAGLVVLLLLAAAGYVVHSFWWHAHYYETTWTEYQKPPQQEDVLVDDTLAEKPPAFDATLIDSRPLGDWEVNTSAAVVRLDCPMIKPDSERRVARAAAVVSRCPPRRPREWNEERASQRQHDRRGGEAIRRWAVRGGRSWPVSAASWGSRRPCRNGPRRSLPICRPRAPPGRSWRRPWNSAGASPPAGDVNQEEKAKWLADFEQDNAASKPIGFYTWTPELQRTWRFFRFLQHEFDEDHLAIPRDVAAVLKDQRRSAETISGDQRLLRPLDQSADLPAGRCADRREAGPATMAKQRKTFHPTAALFPPSTSRETELFERLFPDGLFARCQLDGSRSSAASARAKSI